MASLREFGTRGANDGGACLPDDVSGALRRPPGPSNAASRFADQVLTRPSERERFLQAPPGVGPGGVVAPRSGEEFVEMPLPPGMAAPRVAAPSYAPRDGGLVAEFQRFGLAPGKAPWMPPPPPPAAAMASSAHFPGAYEAAWNQAGAANVRTVTAMPPPPMTMRYARPYTSGYWPRYTAMMAPAMMGNPWAGRATAPPQQESQASASTSAAAVDARNEWVSEFSQTLPASHSTAAAEAPPEATHAPASFEAVLRDTQQEWQDTFDDDFYAFAGRRITDTPYRFEHSTADNRYLQQAHQQPSLDNRAAALEALAEGERLYAEGQLAEAIMAFEAAVKLDSTLSRAWYFLGVSHAESDQDPQAIASLRRVLECHQEDASSSEMLADALLCLAVSYTNELNQREALNYLQRWLDLHPAYRQVQAPEQDAGIEALTEVAPGETAWNAQTAASATAAAYQQQRRLMKRVSTALQSVPGGAEDADLHSVLGVLHNLAHDYDAAVASFRSAVQRRPDDYRLWNRLGATLANHYQGREALSAYRSAIDLRENFVRAWVNVGTSYANQGAYEQAAKYYVRALRRNPRAVHIWSYLRTACIAMNRMDLLALTENANEGNLDAIAAAVGA